MKESGKQFCSGGFFYRSESLTLKSSVGEDSLLIYLPGTCTEGDETFSGWKMLHLRPHFYAHFSHPDVAALASHIFIFIFIFIFIKDARALTKKRKSKKEKKKKE